VTGSTSRWSTAVRDVRALGSGAPLRLGLELSKRTGLHGALFGRLGRSSTDRERNDPDHDLTFVAALPVPDVAQLPATVRARAQREAASIASGIIEVFGVPLDVGVDPDWHAALDGPERWPALPWWQIDIRSSARLGDVKWVWELGRHRHLVVLARAAAIEPEGPWVDVLEQQLTSWLDANPFEIGIHWYSNLEIALRAIAWVQVLGLAGSQLSPALARRLHATLHHAGRHLLADIPYSVSTMRNNHLLGDALGLSVLGRCFPDDRRASRWRAAGDRLFDRQLRVQLHDDGSMLEDSVSYHRFVLEMLAVRAMLGEASDETLAGLANSAELLVRLGALDGEVPRYGDGDEGRVLVASPSPNVHAGTDGAGGARGVDGATDLAGSIHAARLLAHARGNERAAPVPTSFVAALDEVAWYVPTATVTMAAGDGSDGSVAEVGGRPVGGGVARAAAGPFTVWLKAGGDWSHSHADLCSTTIRLDGGWVIGDPGTGTYNGPPEQRDYFRTSIAHSVLRIDGLDQLEPHRAFRWRHPAVGAVGDPITMADGSTVMWGWHGSYRRLVPSRRVTRAVVLDAAGTAVTVADWIEGPPGIPFALSLPLAPGATYDDGRLRLSARRSLTLSVVSEAEIALTTHEGESDPFDGWWSERYGAMEPSMRVEAAGLAQGPVVWQVAMADAVPATVADDAVHLPAVTLRVTFATDGVELVATDGGDAEQRRHLPTP
jgi:hypothetical protein